MKKDKKRKKNIMLLKSSHAFLGAVRRVRYPLSHFQLGSGLRRNVFELCACELGVGNPPHFVVLRKLRKH